ncbi:hypothetical protein [Pedobacter nototheniae]|uniref:hypothetical protein n=1 Tax=Pedobacter nototheniae TaxID=2488994 RepID=UPI00292E20D0|nr:hypothetical protein [Pedobacter nototheniae]
MDDRKHNKSRNENDIALDQFRNNVSRQPYNPGTATANQDYSDVFYFGYNYLDTISKFQKEIYQMVKLDKDSLVNIDFTTKFKVLKNSYLQNTHDNTLRYAVKTPQNLSIFIHSVEGKSTLNDAFKSLKGDAQLRNFRDFIKLGKTSKFVSYSIRKKAATFKGIACLMGDEEYKLFIEFESNKLSQMDLEAIALRYTANNLISKK